VTRLVVFDLDGTLVDSARQIVGAMRAGFAAVERVAPDDGAILSIVGLSLPLAVEALSAGIGPGERDRIVAAYRATFLADPEAPPLYPRVAETLAELSACPGLALSNATGKTRRGLVKVFDQHGLRSLFGSLHGSDEHPSKPDPAMLRAAMAAASVGPERTVMVGDSTFDIRMAQAAGAPSLGVAWGYHPREDLRAAGAVAIVESFADIPAAVDAVRVA
jgi:phosphoglycolate phosphatase